MGAKKSNKTRKIGRNKLRCLRYQNENKKEKNKIVRLTKLLGRHISISQDKQVLAAIERCKDIISGYRVKAA